MQVKKYRAKTIKGAIGRVRKVLGPEAMIISTRRLGERGESDGFEIAAVPAGDDTSNKDSSTFGEVKSELMSIKEMIYLLNHSSSIIEKLMMNPTILNLYAKLIRNGVSDHYARVFLERAGTLQEQPADHTDNIRDKTIKEIMHVIEVKDPFEACLPQPARPPARPARLVPQSGTGRQGEAARGMSGQARDKNQVIAAFIGTTGVGKTTTIAKLAAQLMLKARKKVGLISIDSYRIGAMEQLKTYAHILGIPCFPAFNRKDLLFALRKMEGRDVVLIDTAGQSQYDMSRIEELKKMMTADLAISSHLLLSVGTTESEMSRTAINFGPLQFQSYIFTKIDEAERCGSIINQIMKLHAPISYITTGQNVPEDIEGASKEKILNLLLMNRN
jgi:flagellar biosynthesis protein FlhF